MAGADLEAMAAVFLFIHLGAIFSHLLHWTIKGSCVIDWKVCPGVRGGSVVGGPRGMVHVSVSTRAQGPHSLPLTHMPLFWTLFLRLTMNRDSRVCLSPFVDAVVPMSGTVPLLPYVDSASGQTAHVSFLQNALPFPGLSPVLCAILLTGNSNLVQSSWMS